MAKLGIYLLANYPTKEIFLGAVQACQELGVDFLEVGFAFSDPVADGELLERASIELLKTNRTEDFFRALHASQRLFKGKIYIMTYSNLVYRGGISNFVTKAGLIEGLILADLPLREMPRFERELKGTGVNLIRFVTPESREDDIASALKAADGFIYFISKRGTTGGNFVLDEEAKRKIALVRRNSIDVCIGFGIQDKADLEKAYQEADGAIIGTKAVAELERGLGYFRDFLKGLQGVTGR